MHNKYQFFGVYKNKTAQTNGVIFEVSDEEILRFNKRERYYTKEIIDNDKIDFIYGSYKNYKYNDFKLDNESIVYVYMPNGNMKKIDIVINTQSKSYMKKCLWGCIDIGKHFLIDFIKNTPDAMKFIQYLFRDATQ